MRNFWRRLTISVLTALLAAGALTFADVEARSINYDLDIPSEDLTTALQSFAIASHHKLLYKAELTAGKISRPLKGHFTAAEAIGALLYETGLTFKITGASVVLIEEQNAATTGDLRKDSMVFPPMLASISQVRDGQSIRLAQATFSESSTDSAATSKSQGVAGGDTKSSDSAETGLQELTVTAQKYKSTIQDTPISMSALSGDQLVAAGITSVVDVAHDIPGLSIRSAGPGLTEFEARGLSSAGGVSPTVGFYLDEVPLSPPALSQSGKVVIDPNLYDIDRVEVLRGPQGTLYGSGSMGGTIKIVTNQPKLGVFEGSAQATGSYTEGGNGNGSGNLMLNIPLGDMFALRMVASDLHRSGWIDRDVVSPFPADGATRGNVLAGPITSVTRNVNTEDLYGWRGSLLFKPNEDLSITAGALYQRLVMGGYDLVDVPPGPSYRAHYEAFNIPEPVTDTVHLYSLTVNWHLGFADLTSASSYWDRYEIQTQDASESIYNTLGGTVPLMPLPFSETDPSHQFSQEIRLSSSGNDRLHWTGGAFFSNMTATWIDHGAGPSIPAPGGLFVESINPYNIKQSALFADGSYKFTDTLTLASGVRWYDYQSKLTQYTWGYISPIQIPPTTPFVTRAADRGFNPRVNLSYEPSPMLNTYVTASKGFRPGGANFFVQPQNVPPHCPPGSPESFGPDSVWNYEIGEKAKLLDNRLSINSDIYYIKWNGIQQLALLSCGAVYNTNAGNGRSFGPELEILGKITDSWMVSLNGAYTDAKITHPTAAYTSSLIGLNGQPYCGTKPTCTVPILNVPRDTAAFAIIYTADVANDYKLTARVTDSYTGTSTDTAFYFGVKLPSYSIAAARATLSHDTWSTTLFVDNLTNKQALMTANNTTFQFNIPQLIRYTVNQPRTVGMQLDYHF
jgi:iron complex outermembrane receptor protein